MQDQKLTKPKTNSTISPYESTQLAKYGYRPEEFVASQNQPIEYFTGWVTFCGQDFQVSPAVLIPRVETEELVSLVFESCQKLACNLNRPIRLIEVGTGSGALGLSLALKLETAHLPYHLVLSDISPEALEVARSNHDRLLLDSNISFHQGSLLATLPPQEFDLIVANLPYIPSARIPTLDPGVIEYEPHLALDGGEDGLRLIAELLSQTPEFSLPHTEIWLELDETHTSKQLESLASNKKVTILKDSFDKIRFAHLVSKT